MLKQTREVESTPQPAVVGKLDRRHVPGVLPAVVILAIAAMIHGINMSWRFTDQIATVWAVAVILATLCVVFGVRTWQRYRQLDIAIDAILPLLAPNRPTRELVTARRWSGWVGVPELVDIEYAPPTKDFDAGRGIQEMTTMFSMRMGETYKIAKHDPRRCRIRLKRDTSTPEKPDPDKTRLTDVIGPILPGVAVKTVTRDDETGKIELIEFTWPSSTNERAGRPFTQKRVLTAIRDAFNDETLTVNFDLANETGRVTPITPLPDAIAHPPRDTENPMKVAFGQFRDGAPCVWDLDAPLPHVLIVGGTGGGKTVLLLSILTALPVDRLARADDQNGGVEVWPIDPKRLGLFNLDLIPGARRSATREETIVDYILTVKEKMDARYAHLEKNGPHLRETLDPIVLVIDEGEEMNDILTDWWKSGAGKEDWKERFDLEKAPTGSTHPAMTALGSILRLGREARVHVILASQQAAASWLSTSSRGQFAVRIALRNLEPSTSMMTFGTPIATSGLENKPGRAWVSVGMGVVPEHAQIYWTPKLAPGLNDSDRAILHGLGITLPDDTDHQAAPALAPVASHTEPSPDSAADDHTREDKPRKQRHLHIVTEDEPDDSADAAPNRGEDAVATGSLEVPAADLEEGMRILVDIDGHAVAATVESVDIDFDNDDYLAVTYTTDDGELASTSLPETETFTVTD